MQHLRRDQRVLMTSDCRESSVKPEHELPFWMLPRSEQKRSIEQEVGQRLTVGDGSLSGPERYFLREALGHALAGRYELAAQSMNDVYRPMGEWTACFKQLMANSEQIEIAALARALRYTKGMPTRDYPVF
jgi:hypothetical protein